MENKVGCSSWLLAAAMDPAELWLIPWCAVRDPSDYETEDDVIGSETYVRLNSECGAERIVGGVYQEERQGYVRARIIDWDSVAKNARQIVWDVLPDVLYTETYDLRTEEEESGEFSQRQAIADVLREYAGTQIRVHHNPCMNDGDRCAVILPTGEGTPYKICPRLSPMTADFESRHAMQCKVPESVRKSLQF